MARVLQVLEQYRVVIGSVFSVALLSLGGFLAWIDWHPPQSEVVVSRSVIKPAEVVTTSRPAEPIAAQASAEKVPASAQSQKSGVVNINTAGIADLDRLPGIGKSYAQRIIDYREQNGLFKSPHDIVKVKGIGEGTYAKIKDQITTGGQ